MPEICNLTDDMIKNVRRALIVPSGQSACTIEAVLSSPSLNDIITSIENWEQPSNMIRIRLLPGDVQINEEQKESNAGVYCSHSYSITVQPNQLENKEILNSFTNRKVLLFLFTTHETYLIGCNEQPLKIFHKEYTTYYTVTLSADTYFFALRN